MIEIKVDITTQIGKDILCKFLEKGLIPTINAFDGEYLIIRNSQPQNPTGEEDEKERN